MIWSDVKVIYMLGHYFLEAMATRACNVSGYCTMIIEDVTIIVKCSKDNVLLKCFLSMMEPQHMLRDQYIKF